MCSTSLNFTRFSYLMTSTFQDLQPRFNFLDKINVLESSTDEFKELQNSVNVVPAIRDFLRDYMIAFRNTSGG